MYNKTEFSFPSASGLCDIHAAKYLPNGAPKAVLQISQKPRRRALRRGFVQGIQKCCFFFGTNSLDIG